MLGLCLSRCEPACLPHDHPLIKDPRWYHFCPFSGHIISNQFGRLEAMAVSDPTRPMLPVEIIDMIMEMLANDNHIGSLKCSALACHSFLKICRKYLFSKITIYHLEENHKTYQAHQFQHLLTWNPSVAGYVRQVSYIINGNRDPGPLVLHHLHRITSLTLWLKEPHQHYQAWDMLTPSFKSYFSTFIQSNQIVELRLLSIQGLPAMFFTHFPHLTSLALEGTDITDGHDNIFPRGDACPKLVVFDTWFSRLGEMVKFLESSTSGTKPVLNFTNLQTFYCLAADEDASMNAIKIVLRSAEAIECLGLHGEYPYLNFFGAFANNLSRGTLKALRKVTISPMIEEPEYDPYAYFTEELEKIAGKNVIEELKIHISVSTNCICTTDPAMWSRLDEVLSQPGGFPFLWRVEFTIVLLRHSRDYTELRADLENIGEECFPWLWENEDINFSFDVSTENI